MKQWRQFPKRECKRAVVDICSICGVDIIKGQKYFDKGTFQRVHEHCAPPEIKEAELPASDNKSSPKLPELTVEIYYELLNEYRQSTWTYPPYMPIIKRVLEIAAGKIGR